MVTEWGRYLAFASIFSAGVATSIDAVALIATALFSTLGMVCGTAIGRKFGQKSKLAAGIVLVIIGIRIILQ